MANRFPLIIDIDDSKIKELSANDNLDLTGNEISAVQTILPEANGTYDLGSAELRWRDLYLSGNSINLGDLEISYSNNVLSLLDGNNEITFTVTSDGEHIFDRVTVNQETTLNGNTIINGNITVNGVNTQTIGTESQVIEQYFGANASFQNIVITQSANIVGTVTFTDSVTANTIVAESFSGDGTAITNVDSATVGGNTAADLNAYANAAADEAYSNAVLYTDNAANTTYANAVLYIDTEISNLINAAPGVLDTLNELAAAINDDENFFTTVNNNINTAYSNATAYANAAADEAYSNAVSYTNSEITDLIDGSVLNTLNAISVSINNDTDFANTVTTQIETAYTNATSYANAAADEAYSNATAFATNVADAAYTNAVAYVDAQTTDTIEEGNTNLYYLDSRVDSHLSAANGISYSLGLISADQDISSGANVTFTKVTGLATPIAGQDAATKTYVDELAEGLKSKPAAEVITLSNLSATYDNANSGIGATLTASSNGTWPTIDGYLVTSNTAGENGVLVAGQANAAHNGRYNIIDLGSASTPWVLERCSLCDEPDEIAGAFVFIKHGNTYGGTGWIQIVDDAATFVVGTDDITITQFSQAGVYTANDGLILDGLDFRVDANIAGDYLTYTSGVLSVDTSITAVANTIVLRGANNDVYANAFSGDGTNVTNVNAATVGGNTAGDLRAYSNAAADEAYSNATSVSVPITRVITAGDGLSGGGDLSADRTIDVDSTVVRTSSNQTISGIKTFDQNTSSTSTSTGSIVISGSGGLGVGGNTNIGGDLNVTGIITENGSNVVIQTDIGTDANQIPLNQFLGTLAYQDGENIAGDYLAYGSGVLNVQVNSSDSSNTIVVRDSDGSFSANVITATIVYSNTATTLVSNNVQDAIDEVSDKHDALNQTQGSISIASANTVETVSSFAISSFRTGKYIVSVYANTDVYASEIIVTHDGTNVYITEYGVLASDEYMTFSADIDSGNLRLRAQSTIPNANVDFTRTLVVV